MLVMLLSATTPLPLNTRQTCSGNSGGLSTVTSYGRPVCTAVGNVNDPLAVGENLSLPLLARTRPEPSSPLIVPPIVNSRVTQVTTTFVTS
jgi:hypothetical protein